MSAPRLQVRGLTLRFGGLTAVSGVDLDVEAGEVAAVIGPNGAGKTSLFNAITGIYEPTEGVVALDGQDVRAPLTPRVWAGWLATGCLSALVAVLSVAGVDALWKAVIKSHPPWEFELGQAIGEGLDYLAGQGVGLIAIAALGGFAIGTAGARAVWQRSRRTPQGVAMQGVARTFQNIRLFHQMTVLENVLVAMDRHLRRGAVGASSGSAYRPQQRLLDVGLPLAIVGALLALGWWTGDGVDDELPPTVALAVLLVSAALWLRRIARQGAWSGAGRVAEAVARHEARELLQFVGLAHRAAHLSKNLAYGEQRRLEIARALATRPKLLLLDEPAAGMNPSETVELMALIRAIRDRGVTVLLIEHHMRVVMGISDHITVLVHGKRIAHGTPEQIRHDPKVIEAYLGAETGDHHG